MPRPVLPPTPASSTDIAGKKDVRYLAQLDHAFTLPPAAIDGHRGSTSSASVKSTTSSYQPPSPTSPASLPSITSVKQPADSANQNPASASSAARRRSGMAQPSIAAAPVASKQDYTLPPPPTRSRKIIQMKPRTQEAQVASEANAKSQSTILASAVPTMNSAQPSAKGTGTVAGNGAASGGTAGGGTTAGGGGKRKQASGSTAAGRKIARKTAHSLIERRRRSKMNEEFGVLKDMIPACAGQEMHKLAILQASIEYMRYLERCVSELKAANHPPKSPLTQISSHPQSPDRPAMSPPELGRENLRHAEDDGASSDSDEEMTDADPSPRAAELEPAVALHAGTATPLEHRASITSLNSLSPLTAATAPSTSISPALGPSPSSGRLPHPRNYAAYTSSAPLSNLPSPSIDSQQLPASAYRTFSRASFSLTSPMLGAISDSVASGTVNSILARPATEAGMPGGAQGDRNRRGGSGSRDKDDHEATAALLMLNTDRRSWNGGGRGMSVKDLLSG